MATHHIKIKQEEFEPAVIKVNKGDQIRFQLSGRADSVEVTVVNGTLFAGGNTFMVNSHGQEKTIIAAPNMESPYRLSAKMSTEIPEQTGTMNGSITVIP